MPAMRSTTSIGVRTPARRRPERPARRPASHGGPGRGPRPAEPRRCPAPPWLSALRSVRILRTANNWLGVAKRSTQSCELLADARRKNCAQGRGGLAVRAAATGLEPALYPRDPLKDGTAVKALACF